jgi:uncharacterized protein (TIGR02391 family)
MDFVEHLPTAASLLDLEPEELAGFLLEWMTQGTGESLNLNNFTIMVEQQYQHDRRVGKAFAEAWAYLVREGLLIKTSSEGWYFVSRRGMTLRGRHDLQVFRRSSAISKQVLHPLIAEKSWSPFFRGEYDTAVFAAFKEVEVQVRDASGLPTTDIGVDLMGKAFNYQSGKLTDASLPEPERRAMAALFTGAIGLFKNPGSHRHLNIIDPVQAGRLLMFASELLAIVDSRRSSGTRAAL